MRFHFGRLNRSKCPELRMAGAETNGRVRFTGIDPAITYAVSVAPIGTTGRIGGFHLNHFTGVDRRNRGTKPVTLHYSVSKYVFRNRVLSKLGFSHFGNCNSTASHPAGASITVPSSVPTTL